jgi:predicted PurR-regulated permease PerM
MVLSATLRHHARINSRQLAAMLSVVLALVVLISSSRTVVGRSTLSSDSASRVNALRAGIDRLTDSSQDSDDILDDFIYRLDGNAFGGLLYEGLARGGSPAALDPIFINLRLAIPSFLDQSKFDIEDAYLVEKSYLAGRFGMRHGIDYLAMTLCVVFGCFGQWGLFLGSIVAGWLFAVLDNWLQRSQSMFAVVAGFGISYSVLFSEQGMAVYFLTARAVLVLYVLFGVLMWSRRLIARARREVPNRNGLRSDYSEMRGAREAPRIGTANTLG